MTAAWKAAKRSHVIAVSRVSITRPSRTKASWRWPPAMNAFRQAPAAPRWAASVAVLVPESSIDDRPRNSSQISTAIHNRSWLEWLTVPFTFLFINVFEWAVSCHRPFFEDFREGRARIF